MFDLIVFKHRTVTSKNFKGYLTLGGRVDGTEAIPSGCTLQRIYFISPLTWSIDAKGIATGR